MSIIKTILLISLGVIFGAYVFNHSVTAVTYEVVRNEPPETVEEWIDYYAKEYGASAIELKKVAWCESGYKVTVYGDGGRAFSVFQFHKPTFDSWSKRMGENLDYNNFQHHIKLASWAFAQGNEYKDDWTCWTKMYR
jgi:hypothetical protein